jgi:membrane protease YdiL (CAAX protease family)
MSWSALRPRLLGYALMAALGAAWSLHVRGTIVCAPRAMLNNSPSFYALLAGCIAATLFAWLMVYATRVLVTHTLWARALHTSLRAELLGLDSLQMAVLALVGAFSEELFFRAALSSTLGLMPASLVFAVAHLARGKGAWPRAMWAFGMGVCLSLLLLMSGSLLPPVLAHCIINYENMQYICNYDPTPLDMDLGVSAGRTGHCVRNTARGMADDA